MASIISALTSGAGGISMTGDASGILNLNSNGTNVVAVTATGATVTGTLAATGAVSGTTGTFTGVSTFPAGTALLPAITTTGDTNTGLWFPAADTVAASTGGTERMRIDSSGNVLVGKTVDGTTAGFSFSPTWWAANVGHALVSGNSVNNAQQALSVYTTSSSQYQFYVGYGGTVYARSASITALSDISEKENIKDLETGIGTVLALKPRRFDWKNGSGTNIAGFIAQEVQSVLPDLVESYRVSEDETKLGLKMGDMIPTLVKAIQELKAIVDAQAVRIAALES